jgi:hypothetical protein
MDKVKAEIEKIIYKVRDPHNIFTDKERYITKATSSLTSLIIKWLESKKLKLINENNPMLTDNPFENSLRELRNQLITELIGEVR